MDDKNRIIELFNKNVRNKSAITSTSNEKHDGKKGHWLEDAMGVKKNSSNTPDLFGYEMKNNTTNKTTFGDWSADHYIFSGRQKLITRDQFLMIFGKPNSEKGNRYSWSGEPCPNIHRFNNFGQKLQIDEQYNVIAIYNFNEDKRVNKKEIVPSSLQMNSLILAKWSHIKLRKNLETKFNQKGWFKCISNNKGIYEKIVFGDPITFETWIKFVKSGDVFFDSGMYQGNNRPYSQWRSTNKFWDSLITSTY